MTTTEKKLSKGQLAYEQERARKAGKTFEEWMKEKAKAEAEAAKKAAPKVEKNPACSAAFSNARTSRCKQVRGRFLEKAAPKTSLNWASGEISTAEITKIFAPRLKREVSKRPLFEKSGTKNFFELGRRNSTAQINKIFCAAFLKAATYFCLPFFPIR